MARGYRRRKPRVAWLPTFGGSPVTEWAAAPWAGVEAEIDLDLGVPTDGVAWDAFPLTFDVSESADDAQASPTNKTLEDIVKGNEWRLRRLVGKAFVSVSAGVQSSTVTPAVDVALGFIVSKTEDDGTPDTNFDEVNPLSQNSMEDPWIWRRRWILHPYGDRTQTWATPFADDRNVPYAWGFPSNTTRYGSVADGPHIDAKTARVIRRSERLYGCLAARRYYAGGAVPITDTQVKLLLDYRLLGSLRGTSYGNRGNMSR